MFLQGLAASFIDFLYPPLCLSCADLLDERAAFLCDACRSDIRPIERIDPAFLEVRDAICNDGTLDDIIAPYWFDKQCPLQAVIHALKYQHIPQVGVSLGEDLGRRIMHTNDPPDVLIPVPLHPAKLREREYNQAEQIARGVMAITGARVITDTVFRTVNTRTQTELTALERRRNVAEAFRIGPTKDARLMNASVMIIDDVLTTGATISELARLVRACGCSGVRAGTTALAAPS